MILIIRATSEPSYMILSNSVITILHMAKLQEVIVIHPNKETWTRAYYG